MPSDYEIKRAFRKMRLDKISDHPRIHSVTPRIYIAMDAGVKREDIAALECYYTPLDRAMAENVAEKVWHVSSLEEFVQRATLIDDSVLLGKTGAEFITLDPEFSAAFTHVRKHHKQLQKDVAAKTEFSVSLITNIEKGWDVARDKLEQVTQANWGISPEQVVEHARTLPVAIVFEETPEGFADAFRSMRYHRKQGRHELAERGGVNIRTVNAIEKGEEIDPGKLRKVLARNWEISPKRLLVQAGELYQPTPEDMERLDKELPRKHRSVRQEAALRGSSGEAELSEKDGQIKPRKPRWADFAESMPPEMDWGMPNHSFAPELAKYTREEFGHDLDEVLNEQPYDPDKYSISLSTKMAAEHRDTYRQRELAKKDKDNSEGQER